MLADELTLITTIVNVALSVANAVMLAVNLFLVNRRTKETLQVSRKEHRLKIFGKTELRVELLAKNNREELKVTNTGKMSIDKVSLNVSVLESGTTLLERKDTFLGFLECS
jgi:hypothetical protein